MLGGPSVVDIAVWEVILNGWKLIIAAAVTCMQHQTRSMNYAESSDNVSCDECLAPRASKSFLSPVQADILSVLCGDFAE